MDQRIDSAVNIRVEDTGGTGRPVVLIHGWPLSGEAWAHQVPALRDAGFRVITYDRRGFGRSDKPDHGYDYDTMADDLEAVMDDKDLRDVTLVGFSMGGGEVARYVSAYGEERLHSIVFASAVPPFMMKSDDNPEGPLDEHKAEKMEADLKQDRSTFFDAFTRDFFSANGDLQVSEPERQMAISFCEQSDETAALECMEAFGTTDFRNDLKKITVPTLVLHGDADGVVPIEGSGERTHRMVPGSEMHVIQGAPHGCNVSHADEFNRALIAFLRK